MTGLVCDCNIIHEDAVKETAALMPPEHKVYDLADFFKMLGDSTRMKILWALELHELCVCDLSALLNMTKSAVSHQLKALRQAKLVRCRKEGKNVYYMLADSHVRMIIEMGVQHIDE